MKFYVTETKTPTSNPQTLIQVLAPTNTRVRILGAEIGLRGSTPATTPIAFDWVIQTSAGTSTAITGQKRDRGCDESIRATILTDFSAEPTGTTQVVTFSMHQQAMYPWRPRIPILVKGGERVGLRYRSATYVETVLTLYVEE